MRIYAKFISNNGKKVQRLVTADKRRVLRKSEATKWEVAHLKVTYGHGMSNEAMPMNNRKDFNLALNAFTEK